MSNRSARIAPAEVAAKGGRVTVKALPPSQSRPAPRRGLSRTRAQRAIVRLLQGRGIAAAEIARGAAT